MSNTPELILQLVETFDRNIDNFKKQNYNEAQVRQQFINPFFEALGWDMQNKAGIALAYSDVIHEDAIKVGGATKAPDYCFRIGGTRKFFLEAKKPSVDIKSDISPAYQLRRYAWSAKLPLSILTDFEEFAVYDCQIRPNVNDKPSTARIFFCGYKEYGDKWEQIANIFSKEAVLKGLFDKYASEKTSKRGTTTVDKEFLAEIEGWRDELAKNIALRNGKLSVYDLNFAVQKTIDRILFLRICEDRGIERSEQLLGLINGSRIYPRLFELFEKSDERYNSGIFHFRREKDRPQSPDELSANLKVDDDVLKKILKDLYYPHSPYEFSVMPAEILGNVYEQFLGKVIRLTASHQAKVEEKPEVKKAGGVYYTPSYIVDYIVKNTVGRLLNDCSVIPSAAEESIPNCHSRESGNPPRHCESAKGGRGNLKPLIPKQIEKLKILDPACGSGSFLIGAYQYLLDFHRDYYAKEPSKHKKQIYQGKGGQWFLTIDEKKRILLNNIYGVDIDSQAVEVTKLSLLLKVLENETQETLRLFHERALPDLGNNIKCGNSLIGPDFYQNQQLNLFGDEQQRKINAFDWQKEFPEILTGKTPGFDAVIGNPPYGMATDEFERAYFEKKYQLWEGRIDHFELFIERSLALVAKQGIFSFIVPSPLLSNKLARNLRKAIRDRTTILELTNFGMDVFTDPTIHTCIFVLTPKPSKGNKTAIRKQVLTPVELNFKPDYWVKQNELGNNPLYTFDIFSDPKTDSVMGKLSQKKPLLGDICYIRQCIKTGDDTEYVQKSRVPLKPPWKLSLRGKGIARYTTIERDLYVKYGDWLARNWKNTSFYEVPKIVIRETGNRPIATLDLENRYLLSSLYSIYPKETAPKFDLRYLLGILNSQLAHYVLSIIALSLTQGAFTKMRTNQLARLSICSIDFAKKDDKTKHDKMVSLVGQMLELNKKLAGIKNPEEKTRIQRQIEATDAQIDKLVYDLYNLTPDEIKIVEEANQ
jgi:type I restriction-modification system DNA methylase subunit